jgi:hypothetical protein
MSEGTATAGDRTDDFGRADTAGTDAAAGSTGIGDA